MINKRNELTAVSSVRWTTMSSFGKTILQIAQLALLARFMSSADFGVIAIMLSAVALIQVVADGGLSAALIHFQGGSKNQLATLYWVNVLVSTILGALLIASSGWVAAFYSQPVLRSLIIVASCSLIVSGFGQQARALAQKDLKFNALAKIDIFGGVISFGVVSLLAVLGYGVYGVALGTLVAAVFTTLMLLRISDDSAVPGFRMKLAEVVSYLRFGLYLVGNNLINAVGYQADIILGARLVGADAMGYYSVPRDLSIKVSAVINPIVTSVTFPLMAKANGDNDLISKMYIKTIRMTASLNCPVSIFMFLFAEEVINVFLGSKWGQSVELLQAFCVWALVRSTGNPSGSLLLARGRADLSFKWNIASLIFFVPFVYFGSFYGGGGIAMAMAFFAVLSYLPFWYFVIRQNCLASFFEYNKQILIPFCVAFFSVFLSYITSSLLTGSFLRVCVGALLAAVFYFALSWRFNKDWTLTMMEFFGFKKNR